MSLWCVMFLKIAIGTLCSLIENYADLSTKTQKLMESVEHFHILQDSVNVKAYSSPVKCSCTFWMFPRFTITGLKLMGH